MTKFDSWLASQPEYPETCPVCDGPNTDESDAWIEANAIPFCCVEHRAEFEEAEAESERRAMTCHKCHKHFDEHVEVTKVDSEYGEYQDFLCPVTEPPAFQPMVGPLTPTPNLTLSEAVYNASQS